jgi:hypothetical protein
MGVFRRIIIEFITGSRFSLEIPGCFAIKAANFKAQTPFSMAFVEDQGFSRRASLYSI